MAISNTTKYNINAKDVNDLTEDMISKTLLLLNKIDFQVCKDQKTITSMKLIHADHEDLKDINTKYYSFTISCYEQWETHTPTVMCRMKFLWENSARQFLFLTKCFWMYFL